MRVTLNTVSYGIIILTLLLALTILPPLFKPGIPTNIDTPCHYLRAYCVANVDSSVPNNWCNLWQAGTPASQYYFPPIDFLMAMIGKIIGVLLSYKLFLVLAWLAQAVGAYVLLRTLGHKLAAGLAFTMLALQGGSWHFAGFEQVFLVGIWPYVMSTGFWLIGMATFMMFLRKPSYKTAILTILATIFITHPMTLVFGTISYGLLAIVHYKQLLAHRKLTIFLVGMTLAVNAYYIIPFLLKLSLFPSAIGGGLNKDLWVGYIWSKVSPWIWALGAAGLLFMHKQLRWLSGLVIVWTILNFIAPNPFRDYTIGVRFGAFIAPILFMSAAIALERVAKLRIKLGTFVLPMLFVVLLVFIPLVYPMYKRTDTLGQSILLSDHEIYKEQKEAYDFLSHQEGRVLTEETLYNGGDARRFTHSHCLLPVYANKELVGSGLILFPRNRTIMDIGISSMPGNLFHKPFEEYTPEQALEIMQDYNMKWVIVHTNVWFDFFKGIATSQRAFGNLGVLEMPINTSWFKGGEIMNEEYDGLQGKTSATLAAPGQIVMKTHYYPNWKAKVDGKNAKTKDCEGLVCVDVPAGTHEVSFKYRTNVSEWIGYLLSLIALILLYRKWNSNSAPL